MKKLLKNNSLTLVFFLIFLITLSFQIRTGMNVYNAERIEDGYTAVSLQAYMTSGHFVSSTFENWESEFLQMGLFIVLTIFLYQKGSSESKDPDGGKEDVDQEPDPKRKGAPWPVRKGGIWLSLYKRSLTIAMFLLFILSFCAHFYGSLKNTNMENLMKGEPVETIGSYFGSSEFWFECMQNWQSEFLSVFAIIFLSIYLRQKGSPQSKRVISPTMTQENSGPLQTFHFKLSFARGYRRLNFY